MILVISTSVRGIFLPSMILLPTFATNLIQTSSLYALKPEKVLLMAEQMISFDLYFLTFNSQV